jgi:hypothetical protein
MQLALHLEPIIACGGDGDILERRVRGSEHVVIQDMRQGLRAESNLGECNREREGLDIIEYGKARALGRQDPSMELVNVDGDLVREVVHYVPHVHLDVRRGAALRP